MSYSRNNVRMHRDGYADPLPAVNVKIYAPLARRDALNVASATDDRKREAFANDALKVLPEWTYEASLESGWEDLERDAREIFGPNVEVYSQGRSGGWCVVKGLSPVETWDAITLGKWRRFEKWALSIVASRWEVACDIWYINKWSDEYDRTITPPVMTEHPM